MSFTLPSPRPSATTVRARRTRIAKVLPFRRSLESCVKDGVLELTGLTKAHYQMHADNEGQLADTTVVVLTIPDSVEASEAATYRNRVVAGFRSWVSSINGLNVNTTAGDHKATFEIVFTGTPMRHIQTPAYELDIEYNPLAA